MKEFSIAEMWERKRVYRFLFLEEGVDTLNLLKCLGDRWTEVEGGFFNCFLGLILVLKIMEENTNKLLRLICFYYCYLFITVL